MRMEESIEMIKNLPLERIIVATSKITFFISINFFKDSPWCNISETYAAYKYATTNAVKFSRVNYSFKKPLLFLFSINS